MKRNLLCFAAILLSVTAADAQGWFPKPTPNDTLRSTVILPDNGVVFQIYATEAESVAVTGYLPWDNPVRFAKDMVTSIIPYIEDNFRVYTDQANRAMAGLSMGGMETLEVTLNNPEMFSHMWVLSASFAPGNKEVYEYERVRLKKEASRYNKNFKQLVFTRAALRISHTTTARRPSSCLMMQRSIMNIMRSLAVTAGQHGDRIFMTSLRGSLDSDCVWEVWFNVV